MIDTNFFNDVAHKLYDALPESVKRMEQDFERNFKDILQTTLGKLDLVTREEFDVQAKVLERTREKVDLLTAQVAQLEALHTKAVPTRKTTKKAKPADKK
jgi:ubiquinone biosynthesis accessory factor UbiK